MKAIITDLDRTLLHTDKSVSEHTISSPFTDSEFQRVKINGISKIFEKIFVFPWLYAVPENTENYSKKSPQIRSLKNEFASFERL